MLKNILNLDGAQQLSKNEQKTINGGRLRCDASTPCPANQCCSGSSLGGVCYPYNTPGHLCFIQEPFEN